MELGSSHIVPCPVVPCARAQCVTAANSQSVRLRGCLFALLGVTASRLSRSYIPCVTLVCLHRQREVRSAGTRRGGMEHPVGVAPQNCVSDDGIGARNVARHVILQKQQLCIQLKVVEALSS